MLNFKLNVMIIQSGVDIYACVLCKAFGQQTLLAKENYCIHTAIGMKARVRYLRHDIRKPLSRLSFKQSIPSTLFTNIAQHLHNFYKTLRG